MTVCGKCGGIAPRVLDLGAYTDETGELYDYVLYPRGNHPVQLLEWELDGP